MDGMKMVRGIRMLGAGLGRFGGDSAIQSQIPEGGKIGGDWAGQL